MTTFIIVIGFIFLIISIIGICVSFYVRICPDTTLAKDEYQKDLEEKLVSLNFKTTKTIPINESYDLAIDENSQAIAICSLQTAYVDYMPFSSLVECEICQDNSVISTNQIKRAVVGGVIAGSAGAIVGASTSPKTDIVKYLAVKIRTNDIKHPLHTITLLQSTYSTIDNFYNRKRQTAELLYATIGAIIKNCEGSRLSISQPEENNSSENFAEQLRELSSLFHEGILTQEEFDSKKSEILSKM